MSKITEMIPFDDMPQWGKDALEQGQFFNEALRRIDGLIDLTIWMTGCGYDFYQHKYFCDKRNELIKGNYKEKKEK